jgi:sec-independent protein translocase protein TatA
MNLGMPELLIVLAIILLLFGSTRLPQLAKGLGKSIKEFKRGANEGEAEGNEIADTPRPERLAPAAATRADFDDDRVGAKRISINEPR